MPYNQGNFLVSGGSSVLPFRAPENVAPEFGKSVADFINQFKARDLEKFKMILEGVNQGLLDPNTALTGGEGAQLFEKFFGSKPPEAPRDVTETERYGIPQEVSPEYSAATGEAAPPTQLAERQVTKRVGGFQPQTLAQLQRHVISEAAAGRVPNEQIVALSGLVKSRAQEDLFNPAFQERLLKMKGDREAAKLFRDYRVKYPSSVSDSDIWQLVEATSTGKKPLESLTGKASLQEQKQIDIKQYKYAELAQREKIASNLLAQKDRKLDQEQEQFVNKVRADKAVSIAKIIGPENFPLAQQIADQLLAGEDVSGLPPEVVSRIKVGESRKDRELNLRALSIQATNDYRKAVVEGRQNDYESKIEHWNNVLQYQYDQIGDKAQKDYLRNVLKMGLDKMKLPATHKEGLAILQKASDQLGFQPDEPIGFQGFLEFAGQLVGTPGLGKGILVPPSAAPESPRTEAPKQQPKPKPQLGGKPTSAAPKTAKELEQLIMGR